MKKNVLVGLVLALVLALTGCVDKASEGKDNTKEETKIETEEKEKKDVLGRAYSSMVEVRLPDIMYEDEAKIYLCTITKTMYILNQKTVGGVDRTYTPLIMEDGTICSLAEYKQLLSYINTQGLKTENYEDILK